VASLIAKAIAGTDDVANSFSKLGMFVVVVVVGVLIFQLVILSLLLLVITRRNPILFHLSILRPYFIAFAATST
jgi:Na+/H+-dicarboxylate symporter